MDSKDKDELISDYASRVVDDMEIGTLMELVYDMIVAEKSEYEDDELLAEIEEYYPELLEEGETK